MPMSLLEDREESPTVDCREVDWQNRNQFFAISAQLMRRVPVDAARARVA